VITVVLLTVPPVRAAVLEFLQVGHSYHLRSAHTYADTGASATIPAHAGSFLNPADLVTLLELAGETTLELAREQAGFALRLPTYPSDLGPPDHVFLQDMDGAMAVFVWMSPEDPTLVSLNLFQIASGSWAGEKMALNTVQHTRVNGQAALWLEGPYPLRLHNGTLEMRRIVATHALVWEEDGITYRLEGDLSLAEAIRIAESLTTLP
jgi:hypothetical protein